MSNENQDGVLLIEKLKGKRKIFGRQSWSLPVRKDVTQPLNEKGQWDKDNIILDCSQVANIITMDGSSQQIPLSTVKAEALLQLSGQGNPKGDIWGIVKEGHTKQLYRIVKLEEQEKKQLENLEEKLKYQGIIHAMKDEEVRRYGMLLGIQGSVAAIKNAMADTYFQAGNETLKATMLYYLEMDAEERMVYIALLTGLKKPKPTPNQGIYTKSTGLYYNERRLGFDVKDAVSKILNADDRVELVNAIQTYSDVSAEANVKKAAIKK